MRRSQRILLVSTFTASVVILMIAVAVLTGFVAQPRAEADNPILIPTTPVAKPIPAPPAGPPVLPSEPPAPPAPPPVKPKVVAPIASLGQIEIPRIGLVHPVYEGISLRVIDRGPGHWPGTAMPGRPGNSVFAGHRVTHSHPFLRINELVPGDKIIFRTKDGVFTYEMTKPLIVFPKDLWITDPTAEPTMTIFACHPPRSARQRYVVKGQLVSSEPA